MPIYEYRCDACQHEFETIQKISEEPLVECPECRAPKLRKLISAAAFRLKGSGWYETDFKKTNQRNLSKGGPEGGAPGSEPSSSGSAKKSGTKSSGSATESGGKASSGDSKSSSDSPKS